MQYKITGPERLNVTINLPASKSISNRALIIHALSGGTEMPENLSDCDDTTVMVKALKELPDVVDIGAAGTSMRFLTAYLSTKEGRHVITGTERMQQRPIGVLVDALRRLGAEITYLSADFKAQGREGYPPLYINGNPLEGGSLEVPGNISSQYISALLMIGPMLQKGLQLHLTGDVVSRPYIDLTLHVMNDYGAYAEWSDVNTIDVDPNTYQSRPYRIENDWSASSYWYEMMALTKDEEAQVVLPGLLDGSRQGDSAVRYLFNMLGVRTTFQPSYDEQKTLVTLTRHNRVVPRLDYDFKNQPDLAQTLVVTCCALGIPFHFVGLGNLRIKETDRIEALQTELRKLGFEIEDRNDSELLWDGKRGKAQANPVIDTYEDHRMAMAFAPLCMVLPQIVIRHPEVVTKSYPHYWKDLQTAGFKIVE